MRTWLGALLAVASSLPAAAGAQSPDAAQEVEKALNELQPGVQVAGRLYPEQSLAELMRGRVPGVSIAVFHDGRIIYARGFGVSETGGTRAVTPETLFQAASISKPIAATAALALVEQGKLALDEPVNGRLRTWRIPDSPAAGDVPVTLRHLLTHGAGLTVSGFPGYPVSSPLPTIVQILDGASLANTPPVRIDQRPGSVSRYSGGGFTVAQLLLTDAAGEPFAELMRRLVLAPAGMERSTFAQPLPAELRETAAMGHRGTSPIAGGYHVYPELAAAGLWTTPSDLARWALALSADFRIGEGKLLRRETAITMMTPGLGNRGLGVQVAGSGEWQSFNHGGGNEGYRALLFAYPGKGDGIVIMTNSGSGNSLMQPVLIAVAGALGWPGPRAQMIVPAAVPAQALADVVGRYAAFDLTIEVKPNGDILMATISNGSPPSELIPLGNDRYISSAGAPITFVRDANNRVTGVSAGGPTFARVSETP
jgi:CubicO group peptidase (beta-lactamase class C family)